MIANQPVINKILEITATYYLTFLIQIFIAYSISIEKNIVNMYLQYRELVGQQSQLAK